MIVSDPRSETSPATVRKAAGAAAQRCGWSLTWTDNHGQQRLAERESQQHHTGQYVGPRAGMIGGGDQPTTATTSAAAIDLGDNPTDAGPGWAR